MKYSSVIDEAAVKAAGGQVLEDGAGVRVGGWTITCQKGPITADAELERLKGELGTLAGPEQFYGSNELRLTHDASGVSLSFNALDGLKGWVQDKSEPVHVGESEEWLRVRAQDVAQHAAQTLEYDWTFTTSYAGTLQAGASSNGSAPATAAADGPAQQQAAAPTPAWEASTEQIPRGPLTARDPILLYDELPLYESELDDHGSSRLSVKVRVMPRCWYVLLRFWLRVDHVLVRLREARVFCQFEPQGGSQAPTVLREVRHHQGTFAELRAAGAPAEGPAYADQDTAAAALMAVAPVGVSLYRLERLLLLPA